MMLKIITGIAMLYIIIKTSILIVKDEKQISPEHEINIDYEVIDEIVREREQAKTIEDMISSAESYHEGQHEKAVQISWYDPSGKRSVDTFVSEDFIRYAYTERDKIRTSLSESVQKLNRFKTDLKLRKTIE